jgi:hypothetical protein
MQLNMTIVLIHGFGSNRLILLPLFVTTLTQTLGSLLSYN